ncbi:hypothetical protein [Ferrovibrio sp.]|uniref:hypothetical protein n=1 Tax=Ferrovibrio sp. TaxID=1917215 RepID=UPI000CC99A42|nr:hypothetical protein [Ferrovibrio sp.]PJI42197.1 MAG: hypothetical protein CTR53_07095 [Ferrovibrio sp.]
MEKRSLVRPSRDGDQFHYLWAARRCLKLLDPNTDFVSITIEASSKDDTDGAVAEKSGEEVIDIAEYFGGANIKEAKLVRYMQLKHSTLHADTNWTESGLKKTIEGFSRRYKFLLKSHSEAELENKLEFHFVTNRPININISETINDAIAGSSFRHSTTHKKFEKITGLKAESLSAFLKKICLVDRQDDYWEQRHILSQDVRGYLPDMDAEAPLKLKELVTKRALSEGERNPSITKMDVLRALGTDEHQLYPAPCLIKSPENAVERAYEGPLVNEICTAGSPAIIHANAGVGKSVFASKIPFWLPQGSVCITYDCFGNGQYRSASGYRHRHKDALVQIANELAAKGLCHPLIPTPMADSAAYIKAFVHRIEQASKSLHHANSAAVLCIVIDAADNAQMAAEEIGEHRSFVKDLIRETLPDNVRTVFLCRSHRKDMLDPPTRAFVQSLKPFNLPETTSFLTKTFADASQSDVQEFHSLSSANPRVQALALSRGLSLFDTLKMLGPNATTVEGVIGSILENAIQKLKESSGRYEREQIEKICTGLAILRPLIPIATLSKLSKVPEDAIHSFATDLGRPLSVIGETIQFYDEPAETWFRERFKPSQDGIKEFVRNLQPLAVSSSYVASILPQLMLEAEMFPELVELALSSSALPDEDPLSKRDIELQRIQFALKAGLRSRRYTDAAKLALKAGGKTAGDDRKQKLLQDNTDLTATFIDTNQLQEIVSRRTFEADWLGGHHVYNAAVLSGREELLGEARSHLRMAHEWLNNWDQLSREEKQQEEITDSDIAALIFSHVNIVGPANAARNLVGWRPRSISFRVGRVVIRRLLDHGRVNDAIDLVRAAGNSLCLILAAGVELRGVHEYLPEDVARRAFRLVLSTRVRIADQNRLDVNEDALNAITALVESALRHKVCTHEAASNVLLRYLPPAPPRSITSRHSDGRFVLFRAYSLISALNGKVVELRDIAYPELQTELEKKPSHSESRELQELKADTSEILPWYRLWARVTVGAVDSGELDSEIESAAKASRDGQHSPYGKDPHLPNQKALIWLECLRLCRSLNEESVAKFEAWRLGRNQPLYTRTLTSLTRLSATNAEVKAVALKWSIEAFDISKRYRGDAEEKAEAYIEICRAIISISKDDAKSIFHEAVEVSSKIGSENVSRWEAILDLAERAADRSRPAPTVAYNFSRCAELTYEYVARDKYFHWSRTVEALCGLCAPSALAIMSRWRDRGFGDSERILPISIMRLIDQRFVNALDAAPLLAYRAEWPFKEFLDAVLSQYTRKIEKQAAAEALFRYMKFDSDVAGIEAVISKHGISLEELNNLIDFNAQKLPERDDIAPMIPRGEDELEQDNGYWGDIFSDVILTDSNSLAAAYSVLRDSEPPIDREGFFVQAIKRIPVGQEVAFVAALADIHEINLYTFRWFLGVVPDDWKKRPALTQALWNLVKTFVRRYCMQIVRNDEYETLPLSLVSSVCDVSENDVIQVALDAIGETHELATANRLFSLLSLLTTKLSENEALEALSFGLQEFTPMLEAKDGDGPWSRALNPPHDVTAALAGFVWASLAVPSLTLRWEGAHVVANIVKHNRTDLLAAIMNLAQHRVGGAFVDARLEFYKLHALQWLLIGLGRGVVENPAALKPHSRQIAELALTEPHVLIRQLAAQTALALNAKDCLDVASNVVDRLFAVNVSAFPKSRQDRFSRTYDTEDDSSISDDDKFYFDHDVQSYWYEPLADAFGLRRGEITKRALSVIRFDLAYAGRGRWDEDERANRKIYSDGDTYHSHGEYPREDTLGFYHAYHAMMIVAAQLLDTTPIYQSGSDEDEEDSFQEWFKRHTMTRIDGYWLWDRRDLAPLERPSWRSDKNSKDIYKTKSKDFDEALTSEDCLNLWGHWNWIGSSCEQHISVASALVSKDKSSSLLRALSTVESVYDYAIPAAGSRFEIDAYGFHLSGWIISDNNDSGLDRHDRWAAEIAYPGPRPSTDIVNLMALVPDLENRTWRDNENSSAMSAQIWGHYPEKRRGERESTESGSRLQATRAFLRELLCKVDQDLVVQVQIRMSRRYRSYESYDDDEKSDTKAKAKIYVFKADGSLTTL